MRFDIKEILLIPNLITLFRLFLAIPIIYISFNYNEITYSNKYIILIIIIAFISDLADGFVARKLGQTSELGKLLDPLSDKILTAIIIVLFWMLNLVPLMYLIILLARDLIIFIGGILLAKKIGTITPSNYFGKFTIFTIGLYFLSILIFGHDSFSSLALLYFSGILSVLSIIVYLNRGLKLYKNHGNI